MDSVLEIGPVVVVTLWFRDMFFPNSDGLVRATGEKAGGHAYVINGVNRDKGYIRCKNSWDREWGKKGYFFLPIDDMNRLLQMDGECCVPIEVPD